MRKSLWYFSLNTDQIKLGFLILLWHIWITSIYQVGSVYLCLFAVKFGIFLIIFVWFQLKALFWILGLFVLAFMWFWLWILGFCSDYVVGSGGSEILALESALGKWFMDFSEWNWRLRCLFVVDFSIDQWYNIILGWIIGLGRWGKVCGIFHWIQIKLS